MTVPASTPIRRAHVRACGRLLRALVEQRLSRADRSVRQSRSAFYRRVWTNAAADLGLPVRRLTGDALEISLGTGVLTVRNTVCELDSREVLDRAGDKVLVHGLLSAEGIPVPAHRTFTIDSLDQARAFLGDAPAGCVVKPARDTAAGNGVTTGVRTVQDLLDAVAVAAAAGAKAGRSSRTGSPFTKLYAKFRDLRRVPLLIEHQVPGDNYRLLYLDGVLIDAVRRAPLSVVGDGHSTVAQLLERLNTRRTSGGGQNGQRPVRPDTDMLRILGEQSVTLSSVPETGRTVVLRQAINQNSPEDNWPALGDLCESIVEQGARAGAIVGARMVGVDVITTDPRVPLAASGGCVLEVNTTPGLVSHYHGHPGAVDPAKLLLQRLSGHPASSRVTG
ncbi:hypothetical protein HF519_06050 [Pseudonocardia bannensis]|uniref:Cyanophycin synthetase n=2 Tax=Pseudonocardia bannensis TaxID=630973 RepID=A0A848DEW1_9PSEU|nr:hypothetical protein [Pseudonocardia bannensis]